MQALLHPQHYRLLADWHLLNALHRLRHRAHQNAQHKKIEEQGQTEKCDEQ